MAALLIAVGPMVVDAQKWLIALPAVGESSGQAAWCHGAI